MVALPPILTADLFPLIDRELIKLLKSLSQEDWQRQTLAPLWTVKDMAAHLLDGNIRGLSMQRDKHFGENPGPLDGYKDLVKFLNLLNAEWVKAFKRVSPSMLVELLEFTGQEYSSYLKTVDPFEKAIFSVAWAGEQESLNWFHIAREYTEKWHHQQQIRFATGQEGILHKKEFYYPYLNTSMRALPYHYREAVSQTKETILFSVTGEGGGSWYLHGQTNHWHLLSELSETPTTEVVIDGAIAWRIFTKGITKEEASRKISISGNKELGYKILDMLAVMA